MLINGLAVEAEVLISHFPLVCFCNLKKYIYPESQMPKM